jgi:succinate dehydrogenase/fumarate reductase flavoprotein subunit
MKRDKQDQKNVSRRQFIKATATGAGAAALTGSALSGLGVEQARAEGRPSRWDKEADVVIIGAGATGLPAAIQAAEGGASVILVEANTDVGGHAILSGGNLALGGGTSRQKKYGVVDSPDILYTDLTDWSVVEPNGFPDYRYNDKEVIRAFADESAPTYEWLLEHGVTFVEKAPDTLGGHACGNSAPRENHSAPLGYTLVQNGGPLPGDKGATSSSGVGLIRPLEASARKLGVQILLQTKMTGLVRENPTSGRVLGISATSQGKALNIRARKGVILGTGGHSSNVNFRRIFDPRLTEEYQVAGEPYSFQDASGEIAAMSIGASLWGAFNQSGEFGQNVTKAGWIGCQYGYVNLSWQPDSPLFSKARASGLFVKDYQDAILVNMLGARFYDETQGQFPANNYNSIKSYVPRSYLNAANVKYEPSNFINAALSGIGDTYAGGGPIWAIFDSEAVKREGWRVTPPYVDTAQGYFYSADTVKDLAAKIANKYQRKPMPPEALEATIARYNSFVDLGKDADFGKPSPKFKIEAPPFYAAWATPVIHDTRSGLRINGKSQVIDLNGEIIPGLYCGGETAGGFSLHGLARCVVQGRIAGRNAAAETVKS